MKSKRKVNKIEVDKEVDFGIHPICKYKKCRHHCNPDRCPPYANQEFDLDAFVKDGDFSKLARDFLLILFGVLKEMDPGEDEQAQEQAKLLLTFVITISEVLMNTEKIIKQTLLQRLAPLLKDATRAQSLLEEKVFKLASFDEFKVRSENERQRRRQEAIRTQETKSREETIKDPKKQRLRLDAQRKAYKRARKDYGRSH